MLEYKQQSVYRVDTIEELVRNRRNFKVRVSWLGFPGEDTWHNLSDIYHDIPDMTIEYLRAHADTQLHQQAANKLGVRLWFLLTKLNLYSASRMYLSFVTFIHSSV